MDYTALDNRATELLREGCSTSFAWGMLLAEFPNVHSNIIAERVVAALLDADWTPERPPWR